MCMSHTTPQQELIQKITVAALVCIPLLTVAVAVYFLWNQYVFMSDIILFCIFYCITILGIGVGYHRMLTHTGFQTYAPIKAFFVICGAMAYEGAPLRWAATHIRHHAHSDEEDDPHSPLEGFWHAHLGWLFLGTNFEEAEQYAPHLLKDPVIVWVDKYTAVWMLLSVGIPWAIGGWTGLIWGAGVRIFLTTHVTWSVNSICHTFGNRMFETTDQSRNNWLIGLLAFGEGWHNNHHAFPTNAFHGMRWWQFDLSGLVIRGLEKCNLVWSVQRVSTDAEQAHHSRTENMRITLEEMKEKLLVKIHSAQTDLQNMKVAMQSLSQEKAHYIQSAYDDAWIRLKEIQDYVSKGTILKRQRINQYLKEVQELVQSAKSTLQKEIPVNAS